MYFIRKALKKHMQMAVSTKKYGSVEKGDFSFVYVFGSTQDDMNYMTESTDPTDLIHVMEEYVFGMNDKQIYKGDHRIRAGCLLQREYISFDIAVITDQEEGVSWHLLL